MSLYDDFIADCLFERDFPFGLPCDMWHSKNGDIKVSDMTTEHIKNCMRIVGEDDAWYSYFAMELANREDGADNDR